MAWWPSMFLTCRPPRRWSLGDASPWTKNSWSRAWGVREWPFWFASRRICQRITELICQRYTRINQRRIRENSRLLGWCTTSSTDTRVSWWEVRWL